MADCLDATFGTTIEASVRPDADDVAVAGFDSCSANHLMALAIKGAAVRALAGRPA